MSIGSNSDAGDAICRSAPSGPTWGGGGAQWFDVSLREGMAVVPEGHDLRGDVGPEGLDLRGGVGP